MTWEDWLRAAGKPPSDTEKAKADRTEAEIVAALKAYPPLSGRPFRHYVKGSYANNTNVRLNYDVDIAVEYTGNFHYGMVLELKGQPKSAVGLIDSTDPYTYGEFKVDIKAALDASFGASSVEKGDIALRIREKRTTLPADVVPAWEFRRYDRIVDGVPLSHTGSRVFPASGGHRDNFPQYQLDNGIAKNVRTGRRYKRIVRALKRLQTVMVKDGDLTKELPSYITESIVYNVPDDAFRDESYVSTMRLVLSHIFTDTHPESDRCKQWHEVHGLTYLWANPAWNQAAVHEVALIAWAKLKL